MNCPKIHILWKYIYIFSTICQKAEQVILKDTNCIIYCKHTWKKKTEKKTNKQTKNKKQKKQKNKTKQNKTKQNKKTCKR